MAEASTQISLVNHFLDNKILLSKDILDLTELEKLSASLPEFNELLYINKDLLNFFVDNKNPEINFREFEKTKALFEINSNNNLYQQLLQSLSIKTQQEKPRVKVISSYEEISSKKDARDFAMYFNVRLDSLRKILMARTELKASISISRIPKKREKENVSIIGLVKEKQITKNNNVIITLEDNTAEIKVLINKNKPEIYELARDIVLDEVIGVNGAYGGNVVFANNLFQPDVPSNELKKSNEEAYALFLSDLHVGSKNFLSNDFERFINWINQRVGTQKQKEIASKVKYIFIVGDLVDGVGVYPNQEDDLIITDINQQYEACAQLLSQIPQKIPLIICAGNHDGIRLAEPQPPLYKDYATTLYSLQNVIAVSNPAVVNIHSNDSFEGFNVLLYHGYSFDYYVANVDSIRNYGGYDRADLIMKFLLKRRHLAPTHTSTLYVPYIDKDPLIIDIMPDFFVTGHIHKVAISHYKNATLISGSCWQSKTDFQEKVGHHPEPSRVPLINLATREVKMLRFGK